MPIIKEHLSLFETVMYCEFTITNAIIYTVYSTSQNTLCLSRHHSTVNISTVPIVPTKFEGLFHKWTVHRSAPVYILSLLYLSCRRLQILLIVVLRKLWIFGLWGPPRFFFLGMILKKAFIADCLRGFFLSFLSLSLPRHSASSVLEELFAILVLIDNALTGSCCRRKIIRTTSSESYENATSFY